MTQAPRILFVADSGAEIGGGHVLRCLSLARALQDRGAACAFIASDGVRALLDRFASGGIEALDGDAGAAAGRYVPDWLVIDHYRLTCADEAALRAPGRRLMMIDDLADRPRDCDLLLDPGYGRTAADYRGLAPERAQVFAGPDYALVREDFAALRQAALARRPASEVARVLVSLGLTDVSAITGRVVRALLPVLEDRSLDIALGGSAPSLSILRALKDPRLRLHVDSTEMPRLTADADLAIGAGGSSVWERACLGLPAVTLILADNQRALARRMAAEGLTLAVEAAATDFADRLAAAFAALSTNDPGRLAMSGRLAGLCDGLGAGRVAEALLAQG